MGKFNKYKNKNFLVKGTVGLGVIVGVIGIIFIFAIILWVKKCFNSNKKHVNKDRNEEENKNISNSKSNKNNFEGKIPKTLKPFMNDVTIPKGLKKQLIELNKKQK